VFLTYYKAPPRSLLPPPPLSPTAPIQESDELSGSFPPPWLNHCGTMPIKFPFPQFTFLFGPSPFRSPSCIGRALLWFSPFFCKIFLRALTLFPGFYIFCGLLYFPFLLRFSPSFLYIAFLLRCDSLDSFFVPLSFSEKLLCCGEVFLAIIPPKFLRSGPLFLPFLFLLGQFIGFASSPLLHLSA